MLGRQIPAQEERDHDQVANAVMVEVGCIENLQQPILALGLRAHWPDPSRLAGLTIDDAHAPVAIRGWHRPGVRNHELGSAVAIEVDDDGPIDRLHCIKWSLILDD